MAVGDKILDLLESRNMTQKQLAAELGLAATTLNGYIKNYREPDYKTLIRLATYFGVSCDYLLGTSQDQRPVDSAVRPTPVEEQLLHLVRKLPTHQQEFLTEEVKLLYRMNHQPSESPVSLNDNHTLDNHT